MKKWHLALMLVLVLSVLVVAACGSSAAPAPTATSEEHPGKKLVASRCTTCHPLGTIEAAKKDQAGWQSTVQRMVNNGAQLDKNQQVQAIEYLALTYTK